MDRLPKLEASQQDSPPTSASSAVDFTRTSTGLSSKGPSPALAASDSTTQGAHSRKRTSWGKVPTGQDPLNLGFPGASFGVERPPFAGPSTSTGSQASTIPYGNSTTALLPEGSNDPFHAGYHPSDPLHGFPASTSGRRRFSTSLVGPSSASLISRDSETLDVQREDDEAHLTANASGMAGRGWRLDDPPEGAAVLSDTPGGSTTRRRTTLRYTPSPMAKTGSRLRTVSQTVRRMSMRVVNLAGRGLEDHVRLEDADEDAGGGRAGSVDPDTGEKEEDEERPPGTSLPIRGRTLGFLGPTNPVRLAMYRILVNPWSESIILSLIIASTIIFVIQAARPLPDAYQTLPVRGYFHQWEDYAQFCLFVLFTVEAFARIAVTGLMLDPDVPITSLFTSVSAIGPVPAASTSTYPDSSLSRQSSLARAVSITRTLHQFKTNLLRPFSLSHQHASSPYANGRAGALSSSHSRTDTSSVTPRTPMLEKGLGGRTEDRSYAAQALKPERSRFLELPFKLSVLRGREVMQRNMPYLRHSWNRLDGVAVVSFWITFVLASAGVEHANHHIGAFRALSVLRSARLLALSAGTTTIMRSLKTAMPLLTNVAYFVIFAIVMFSIIGLETFKGSLRRTCYLSPTQGEQELQLDGQFCGGYIDPVTLNATGYIRMDNSPGRLKGFVCPLGQVCREADNPNDNTQSFDTIGNAILQVVIVATANSWSPLMYSIIDSEQFASCFFFIAAVLVLNYWLLNLFVAVITNTFSAIRGDTKKSAFGAAPLGPVVDEDDEPYAAVVRTNRIKSVYEHTRLCWVALALASLVLQATNSVDIDPLHAQIIDKGELILTLAFDVEIIIRVIAELPDWRSFFMKANNLLDLVLAIVTSIIQIPAIRHSSVYPWLTAFQLARFYRVILEVPRMRPLLLAVFGNLYGLWSMSVFLILMNGLSALIAIQFLRSDLPPDGTITFLYFFNAFLGVYQVFSSENWTDVLYGAIQAELPLGQSVIAAIFITMWMLFANFIVLQMFIAVINENFDVAEEAKRGKQATSFWAKQLPNSTNNPWLRRLNPYRWFSPNPKSMTVESLPSNLVLPMQKALVQDYQLPKRADPDGDGAWDSVRRPQRYPARSIAALRRLFIGETASDAVPLATLRHARRPSGGFEDPLDEELEKHMEMLAMVQTETDSGQDLNDLLSERRARKADFIREHPSYDKTFWIFSQKNPVRHICQKLVQPANGDRIFGHPASPLLSTIFQLVLLLTVVAGIVVESIATPTYRRQFYHDRGLVRGAWFDIAEGAFTLTLLLEFFIKIVADGFVFTPNSYVRSIWNILDLMVLSGIMINVVTSLIFIGGLSRITRSLKAMRALRLVTLIEKMRSTFQDLIISGAVGIFDAATLAVLYMIPYAVWGFNIFADVMNQCNDGSVSGKSTCNQEYVNAVTGDSFGFLAPRVWDNPSPSTTFSFDDFRSSFLILFEIVSLEGWIDVMNTATAITGKDKQPQTNASEANAIFFLIYNLLGGVVILTLFVSIIIGNFRAKTGTALLTHPQREWIDLQKLLKRQQPSERPKTRPKWPIRTWCFDRAEQKHGWWSRMMTFLFFAHVIVLSTQSFGMGNVMEQIRNVFFVAFSFVYAFDTIIKFYGLGWRSFSANRWNIFDATVSFGMAFTTVFSQVSNNVGNVMQQLQKLFLVAAAFKLVQRVDSLNKLFKTALASLPVIFSLLGLWLIFFLFFAIMFLEVFGLTKWGSAETHLQNYSTLGSALTMLAFMSTGEGWNQYMHDYALVYPRCTNTSLQDPDSDCGSVPFAFALFIAWNLLSMYIFVNMFTGVVVESFSYVFQATDGSKAITRAQMRAFKKVWATYANPKTARLDRENLVAFLGSLTGVFEVRIYPIEYAVPNIKAASVADDTSDLTDSSIVYGEKYPSIDTKKMERALNGIDQASIRKRRNVYIRLYHEAVISCPPSRGLSFTEMLTLLAHYKLIVDREALVLKDLVIRTEVNRVVTDLVHLDRVRSLLKMVSLRRRYLRERDMRIQLEQPDIPHIIVDSLPSPSTPGITRDITSPKFDSPGSPADPDSPTPSPRHSMVRPLDLPTTLDAFPSSPSRLRRSRRTSDMSMLSADMTDYTPRHSFAVDDDPHEIISSMQNSLWGEMMLEAAEEDEER